MSALELADVRRAFEPRWNRWNAIRTFLAVITTLMLLVIIVLN